MKAADSDAFVTATTKTGIALRWTASAITDAMKLRRKKGVKMAELKKDGIRAAMSEQTERETLRRLGQRTTNNKSTTEAREPCPYCPYPTERYYAVRDVGWQ